ncbi:MAG: DUF1232 domain-containing protein [Bacteroidaceae bacterium]|nr:DUF1232 domain-containing protein [Bacteroidales bacterium]MBQ2979081.1 DUF1232 domain-containing protein [Bacteroidaceae bacterium]
MKKSIIQYFRRGRWLRMASSIITDPKRLIELAQSATKYANRRGWKKIHESASLLLHYIADVATQRYTHYNKRALLLSVAAIAYLVTPIDFLPDILIGGLIDDVTVVLYIVQSVKRELEYYDLYRKGLLLDK